MNTMDRQLLQVHDELDEEDDDDVGGGRFDGTTTSTMTTDVVIPNDTLLYLNDNNVPSLVNDLKRLESLIWSDDNLVEIRELLSSLVSSSCTSMSNNGAVNCIFNDFGFTPLIKAVFYGLIAITRCLLIEYGADVTISDCHGKTPLHYAVAANLKIPSNIGLIQLLLDHGGYHHHPCPVNLKDNDGNTPLYLAWTVPVIRLLLQNGANVNIRNHLGETPLYHAVKKHSYEVVKELLYYPSRRRASDESDPNNTLNHEYYDYDLIHYIKADNGSSPFGMIFQRCQELETKYLVQYARDCIDIFTKYQQGQDRQLRQQQLKRINMYSYFLFRHERESKTKVASSSKKEEEKEEGVVVEEGVALKKQKTTTKEIKEASIQKQ